MRLLSRTTRPSPVTDDEARFNPRLAAIRLLKEKVAAGEAGLDPYCPSDFIIVAHENERVWVNRCASLCGVVLLRVPQVGRGERFRVVPEADVRVELGLDGPKPPQMLDEPLASRGVDAPGVAVDRMLQALPFATTPTAEPVWSLDAMREAKAAYDQRYPHGPDPQLVIRTDTPEAS